MLVSFDLLYMIKKNLFLYAIVVSVFFHGSGNFLYGDSRDEKLAPTPHQQKVCLVVTSILDRYHYRKSAINDSLSSEVFDNYINSLDYSKSYFLQEDINAFEKYRFQLDDALKTGNLNPAFDIFNVFKERFFKWNDYARDIMDLGGFDYTKNEYLNLKREEIPWPQSDEELKELWRKRVKSEALNMILSEKEDTAAIIILENRYERWAKTVEQYKSDDVFQWFMNTFTQVFDPHTNYFLPITADNFMLGMSQSFEGIGARLVLENDFTKVVEIIPGGPAFKTRLLMKDDRIIGVAQGDDGEMVDVIGWRLDDVVKLIRGPKGTVVRLNILRAEGGVNALPEEIRLIRDKVKIEEQLPTQEVMTIYRNDRAYRIGVITIPSFYLDFEAARNGEEDYKSTTRDVKKLITELEEQNIDGIIIDLRNNGGGSLAEAIELTGLFIEDGPVVQIKNSGGRIDVEKDPDEGILYDGPIGVLVNRFSASASEIFSGAIQDYKRGIIIGEQTYGKGTVQNLLDLERFLPVKEEKPGQIKLTLAKFYRITGSSTQHKGVIPDIELPTPYTAEEFGEASEPSALPWDQIKPTEYETYDLLNKDVLALLREKNNQRLNTSKYLLELQDDVEKRKKSLEKDSISLSLEIRKKELEDEEKLSAARMKMGGSLEQSETKVERTDESEFKDAYLQESINIIADWLALNIG